MSTRNTKLQPNLSNRIRKVGISKVKNAVQAATGYKTFQTAPTRLSLKGTPLAFNINLANGLKQNGPLKVQIRYYKPMKDEETAKIVVANLNIREGKILKAIENALIQPYMNTKTNLNKFRNLFIAATVSAKRAAKTGRTATANANTARRAVLSDPYLVAEIFNSAFPNRTFKKSLQTVRKMNQTRQKIGNQVTAIQKKRNSPSQSPPNTRPFEG